jgi:hypothetical protein
MSAFTPTLRVACTQASPLQTLGDFLLGHAALQAALT